MGRSKRSGSRTKANKAAVPTSAEEGSNNQTQPNSHAKANDCKFVQQKPPNVYVTIPAAEKDERWSYANKIAAASGAITLALTVFTYLLFVKAGVQADQAIRAANSADSVFSETKKEFEIENEPYLQLMQPKIQEFVVGTPITVSYFFVNLGKYPAKILTLDVGAKANYYPPNAEDSNTFKFDKPFPDYINTVIIKESPLVPDHPGVDERPLTSTKYQAVLSHTLNYYLYGRIQYQNLANNKLRIYSFVVQMDPMTKAAEFIYNDNKDMPLSH